MLKLYDQEYDRLQLLRHVGDISQICGTKQYQLTSGNEQGVNAVDFWTGSLPLITNHKGSVGYAVSLAVC